MKISIKKITVFVLIIALFLILTNIAAAKLAVVNVQGFVKNSATQEPVSGRTVTATVTQTRATSSGQIFNGVFSIQLGTSGSPLVCGNQYTINLKLDGTDIGDYTFTACGGQVTTADMAAGGTLGVDKIGILPVSQDYILTIMSEVRADGLAHPTLKVGGNDRQLWIYGPGPTLTFSLFKVQAGKTQLTGDLEVTGTATVGGNNVCTAAGNCAAQEADTLQTVTTRGDVTTNAVTVGGLTVNGPAKLGGSNICTPLNQFCAPEDIWINTAGDTMTGDLNMGRKNIDDIGNLQVTGTAALPSGTTVNGNSVCTSDGTNCPAAQDLSNYVKKTGDTMTGNLIAPSFEIQDPAGTPRLKIIREDRGAIPSSSIVLSGNVNQLWIHGLPTTRTDSNFNLFTVQAEKTQLVGDLVVMGSTQLGNASTDKTTIKGDLEVTGSIIGIGAQVIHASASGVASVTANCPSGKKVIWAMGWTNDHNNACDNKDRDSRCSNPIFIMDCAGQASCSYTGDSGGCGNPGNTCLYTLCG